LALGATLVLLATTTVARAQEAEETAAVEEARAAFGQAEDDFNAGNYALAMQGFERSYSLLEGHPRRHLVLFNIARCNEELGNLEQAVEAFERYLREGGDSQANADETRRRIQELRERIRSRPPPPSGPGTPGEAGPDTGWLAAAISLEILGGLTGIGSLVTGLVAHDLYTGLEARCVPTGSCPPGSQSDIDTGSALAITSTVLLPISITALAAGTLMLVLTPSGAPSDPEAASIELLPGLGGATLRGRF
jgi:hypothetical protein